MKKAIYFMIIFVLTFLLSACGKGDATMIFSDNDSDFADLRMEQLFFALQENDCDSISSLFSEKAKTESGTIDADSKELLKYIDGDVLSWSRDETPITLDDIESGNQRKLLITWFVLKTTNQTYLVFLADYPVNEIEPDNSGLYTLKIIKETDESKLTGTWEDWTIPGIYVS